MKDLLLEIGCENLPPASIRQAFEQLGANAEAKLEELRLPFESVYATGAPRRLVLVVRGLAEAQERRSELVTGPPSSKAFDEKGAPTKTAEGFARSHGIAVGKLKRIETERGEYVGFTKKLKSEKTAALLKTALPELIAGLRFPKLMKWEASGTRFARPVRWLACVYGRKVIRFEFAGVKSGNVTWVMPWLKKEKFKVAGPDDYFSSLSGAGLTVDHEERSGKIRSLAESEAKKLGMELIEDESLVDELTFMLESPIPLVGDFDKAYLKLPPEVVTTAMKAHQRYLAFRSGGKKLVSKFLTFTEGRVGSPATVREGNEKVLRARLEDALFYWQEDLKTGVDGLSKKLASIVFIEGLGSLADKAERVNLLGRTINDMAPPEGRVAEDQIRRAARFAKADLASEMVKDGKEFTLLEGLIGSHYAKEAGQDEEIVAAIGEQYMPRTPGDALPATRLGAILSIADRVDTITGCFLAGIVPSGSQDPYALRRQATGLVRILRHMPTVSIRPIIEKSLEAYVEMRLGKGSDAEEILGELADFFRIRTETFLKDNGISYDIVGAVGAVAWATPGIALDRAEAVQKLRGDKSFELLITGAKRVGNIISNDMKVYGIPWGALEEAWVGGGTLPGGAVIDPQRFAEDTERGLFEEIRRVIPRMAKFDAADDIFSVLGVLSELGPAIDAYFDDVLVNCDDARLRAARHEFLAAVFALFSRYADFSFIVEETTRPSR
jgi:glycyl-tRNA synthetase beta chain